MYWVYWVYCTSAKNSKNSGTVTHWLLNSMLLPPYQSFHSRKFVSLLPLTSYFGQATHLYMLFQLHHLRLPPPLSEAKRVPWLFQGAGTRQTWPNLTSVMQLPAQALHYQRQIWRAYLCIALMDPHPGEYTHPKHLPDFTGVFSWNRAAGFCSKAVATITATPRQHLTDANFHQVDPQHISASCAVFVVGVNW